MRLLPQISMAVLLVGGCAVGLGEDEASSTFEGEILALSTYEASLGQVIELYGSGLPAADEGDLFVVFEGTYERADGVVEPVSLETPVRRSDGGTLRWGTFGPHRIPFGSSGDQVGTFVGTVHPRLITQDGTTIDGATRTDIELRVLPSILVRDLQPVLASCGSPAKRGIGGLPYRLSVQAVGFAPETFTYTLSAPALDRQPDAVRHLASGPMDTLGEHGDFVLPAVPSNLQAYGAIIRIEGRGADGSTYESAFAIGVHRPLEVFYNGNVEIAEVYAPVPVSACIPGGEAGRTVDYTESMSETRSRSYAVNWNESWLSSHTRSTSRSESTTVTQTNSVGFSTTDGSTFSWHVGGETEVGGEVGLSELISVGLKQKFNYGVAGERSHSTTSSQERTDGISRTETTTDTRSTTESEGGSEGEEFQWQVSSTEQLSRGFSGNVIAGTYGVFYRQTVRLVRHAALVTYNLCGSAEVVGEVDFQDWTWSTDLALGDACPPLPQSNLPEAQCIVAPCQGDD